MRPYFSTLLFCFLFIFSAFTQKNIDRIEPPNWWVDMESKDLQLMVYGQNIGHYKPAIKYDGVDIQQVIRVENPNYLFIDLNLDATVKAGTFDIVFYQREEEVERHSYSLYSRKDNAPYQKGFDTSDILYLITPDRFANGNAKNDELADMREGKDRAFKGGRHGGDIQGIIDNLDYIKDMGFTAIWLNPLLENDMEKYSYHGYSTTDFYKVDPRFGSNEMYQKLAEEADKKGIKLIMDMIVNHCGSFHWWMDDLPMDNWINQWDSYTETNHRKSLLQDPYAATLDKKVFADGWFVPTMPDLNQRNPLMANYLTQNAIWWIEYLGLAGIRMDTYPYPDMDYMTEWTERVMTEYPNFNVVGEEWYLIPSTVSYWQAGKQNRNGYTSALPSLMDFPVQNALVKALTEEESFGTGWIKLYEMLAQDFLYADPYNLVVFPDNHDMSRIFTQLNENYADFKLALTFFLTTRGIPQLYYGTEILMTNPDTDDHGIIRSDFPGGWKGDAIEAASGKGLTDQQKDGQQFLKDLMRWRNDTPTIHDGKLTHFIPKDGVYVYFRYDKSHKYMVILNKNKSDYNLKLDRFSELLSPSENGTDVLSGKKYDFSSGQIQLPVHGALILKVE